jgi:hypothetical protein
VVDSARVAVVVSVLPVLLDDTGVVVGTGAVVALVALGIVGAVLLTSEEEEPQPVAIIAIMVAITAETIISTVFFILKILLCLHFSLA